jgi:hypothetical protein
VVPFFLPVLLLAGQALALVASVRTGLWRAVPAWVAYVCLATMHLITGLVISLIPGSGYPVALLYFEPVLMVAQIALTFETCLKVLQISPRGGAPEGRLLLWLIPLVPAAIVIPIEIGFIRDAVENWSKHVGESLMLVYAVRMFLSITLLVVLAVMPLVARLARKARQTAISNHHRALTGYFLCAAIGYLLKSYVNISADRLITVIFFILGPFICFLTWSGTMWNRVPSDLEPPARVASDHDSASLERRLLQNP